MSNNVKLRAGDWVEIKNPAEILQTLDANGAVDGLPFMPEMVEFCGQRAKVLRVPDKICVEVGELKYEQREFPGNDVVILDIPRCSGANHDGCGRACVLFWKTDWIRKGELPASPTSVDATAQHKLASHLKTMATPERYFCQSTEMTKATAVIVSLSRTLLKSFDALRSGSRSGFDLVRCLIVPVLRKITRYKFPRPLVGKQKGTPVVTLDLQPGELVQIKSEAEILETLDSRGRNRGMICDRGLTQYGGRQFRVRNRLDHMISEPTGKMRQLQSTVLLEGLHCLCWWSNLGGCSRDDFMYWREAWLKRTGNCRNE